jgi:hypothetical protein
VQLLARDAYSNLVELKPALARFDARKASSSLGYPLPMHGVYQHERNFYLANGKTQTLSATRMKDAYSGASPSRNSPSMGSPISANRCEIVASMSMCSI